MVSANRSWQNGVFLLLMACSPDVHVTVVVQSSGGADQLGVAGSQAASVFAGSGAAGRAPVGGTTPWAGAPISVPSSAPGGGGGTTATAGAFATHASTFAGAPSLGFGGAGGSIAPPSGGASTPYPETLPYGGGSPVGVGLGGGAADGKTDDALGGATGTAYFSGGGAAVSHGGANTAGSAVAGAATLPTGVAGNTSATTCSASIDFIALAMQSPEHSQIGRNPCGLQGVIAAYSDNGLDRVANTGDETVREPAYDTSATNPRARLSPCSKTGTCCIRGNTWLWPKANGKTLYDAEVWGGGLSVELNAADDQKNAYSGPMRGVILTMDIYAPMDVRILLLQSADDRYPPFATYAKFVQKTYPIYFNDPATTPKIACPTAAAWGQDNEYVRGCVAPTDHPYGLRIEVVGGDAAGDFSVCIESITPIL